MKKMSVGDAASRPAWDTLEMFARGKVQEFIQQLLEDEVTELLGREKSERRAAVDAPFWRLSDTAAIIVYSTRLSRLRN